MRGSRRQKSVTYAHGKVQLRAMDYHPGQASYLPVYPVEQPVLRPYVYALKLLVQVFRTPRGNICGLFAARITTNRFWKPVYPVSE